MSTAVVSHVADISTQYCRQTIRIARSRRPLPVGSSTYSSKGILHVKVVHCFSDKEAAFAAKVGPTRWHCVQAIHDISMHTTLASHSAPIKQFGNT